jgi:dihydropteroate synthase
VIIFKIFANKSAALQNLIRLRSKIMDLSVPKVMGIINITPDSFFAGSRVHSAQDACAKAKKMIEEGVDILDLGAQSTRPGAEILSAKHEWERLRPSLETIRETYPDIPISIDTFHAEVARKSLAAGADMINDVQGGRYDSDMFTLIGESRVPYVLMHSRGDAQTMQTQTQYESVFDEVVRFFHERVFALTEAGATDVILDPGIGFAKTHEHGFELLRHVAEFNRLFARPMLIGVSRKSILYKSLSLNPEEVLPGTDALHSFVLAQGAKILRVHDVGPAIQVVKVHQMLNQHV